MNHHKPKHHGCQGAVAQPQQCRLPLLVGSSPLSFGSYTPGGYLPALPIFYSNHYLEQQLMEGLLKMEYDPLSKAWIYDCQE
jgi:hypothetical protein